MRQWNFVLVQFIKSQEVCAIKSNDYSERLELRSADAYFFTAISMDMEIIDKALYFKLIYTKALFLFYSCLKILLGMT